MAVQLNQQIVTEFDVPATMRDGTILRANVYRPASEGQWPVLLTRLPYGKDFPSGTAVLDPSQVARRGYVGMYGISYFGFTQWAAAVHQPPALKALVPYMTWSDPLNGEVFRGGALEL